MAKRLIKRQWLKIIQIYRSKGSYEVEKAYRSISGNYLINGKSLRVRIRLKSEMLDNIGMKIFDNIGNKGRPKKRDDSDIPSIIDDLNEEQKREIIEGWIKDQRDKKDKRAINKYKTLSISLKARITCIHRTTFYKKSKEKRIYKFDIYKKDIEEIFLTSNKIYGSRRISIILKKKGIFISDRSLRNYMVRWNLECQTRKAKRKSEVKNTKVKFPDLVNRNFNPKEDNIIATDVSYIPADEVQNNVYLSVAISHKTKCIESFKLSRVNDIKLVYQTIEDIKRNDFILHSDHGFQYSNNKILDLNKEKKIQTSMSRIGNSLDNREVEYFFGCLKGEYLKRVPTRKMKFEEIRKHIAWYVNWYNTERIQSRLQWKTPAKASAYVI